MSHSKRKPLPMFEGFINESLEEYIASVKANTDKLTKQLNGKQPTPQEDEAKNRGLYDSTSEINK